MRICFVGIKIIVHAREKPAIAEPEAEPVGLSCTLVIKESL